MTPEGKEEDRVYGAMASSVRHRSTGDHKIYSDRNNYNTDEYKHSKVTSVLLSEVLWVINICFFACMFLFITYKNATVPTPLTISSAKAGEFVEERARGCLNEITSYGDRPVGSYANEKLAVDFFLKTLNEIRDKTNGAQELQVDLQVTSGTFSLPFLSEFSSVYENVNNIIAKLGPKGGSSDSLLVNCHYDTVVDSPGASDDAVSCCLMLEVLLVLSQSSTPLKHNIIFIFNGAEENILQASHGFITQHPWAKDIRAFVNLDAAGAGGRELLFQAGPENPWILRLYADVVPYPSASVFGQEVFETGLIPSETDYRIYRDYGGIPGVDIAYVYNGYVYHTMFDRPDQIPAGCIQRGGANLLAMVRALGDSPLLPNPGEYKHGRHVFYDVLGMFIVSYPERVGVIINTLVGLAVFFRIARRALGFSKTPGFTGKKYVQHLVTAVALDLLTWAFTMVVVLALAYIIHMIGRPLSWYSNQWVLIGLYLCPALGIIFMLHRYIRSKVYWMVTDLWNVEACYHDAFSLMLATLVLIMTYKGVNSAALFMLMLAGPLIFKQIIPYLLNLNLRENPLAFLVLNLGGALPGNLMFMYVVYGVLVMFIPIMGRVGSEVIPDIFISAVVVIAAIVFMGHQVGMLYVTISTRQLMKAFCLVWFVITTLVVLTPVGFPFHYNPASPRLQRQIVHHMDRTFHNHAGEVIKQDSGLWLIPFESYGLTPLRNEVPMLKLAEPTRCDNEGPYCGWPYFFPLLPMMKTTYYLPAPPLPLTERAAVKMVNRTLLSDLRIQRLTFQTTGPDHYNVMIRPKNGIFLLHWSVGDHQPIPGSNIPEQDGNTYFIFYSYGSNPEKLWTFWLDLQVDEGADTSRGIVDIALGAHYIHNTTRFTPELREYVNSMPKWSFTVGWAATYASWVF